MYSNIAVINKHTAKLHHVGSLCILTYDARKPKQKKKVETCNPQMKTINVVVPDVPVF